MDRKKYNKEYNKKYFLQIHGVAKRLYHHMKERSKKHNWKFNFTYDDFSEWLHKTEFENLYNEYVKSNYNKKLKPSIDRIDDMGIYEFSNMRVITWLENWKRGISSDKNINAFNKSFQKHRDSLKYPVIVEKNNFRMLFKDFNEVLECFPFMLRSKICDCCNGKRKTHHGFNFRKYNLLGVVAQ